MNSFRIFIRSQQIKVANHVKKIFPTNFVILTFFPSPLLKEQHLSESYEPPQKNQDGQIMFTTKNAANAA